MLNALTIDVEDYYHVSAFESEVGFEEWHRYESRVEKNTCLILDLLDEYQTKATFFVLGWIAQQQPQLIKEIHLRGHEIASHGYAHQRIYTQTPETFREETRRAKRLVEDIIGQAVIGYRAASYSITVQSLWALDILAEEGFLYDSSIFPIRHDLYGMPNYQRFSHAIERQEGHRMVEVPLSTIRFGGSNIPVAGGGYFRLFPYAFTRWSLRHLNRVDAQPAVVYLHPWEFDPNQPRMHGSALARFRHYLNLDKTQRRFVSLLRDFHFGTMKDVLQSRGFLIATLS